MIWWQQLLLALVPAIASGIISAFVAVFALSNKFKIVRENHAAELKLIQEKSELEMKLKEQEHQHNLQHMQQEYVLEIAKKAKELENTALFSIMGPLFKDILEHPEKLNKIQELANKMPTSRK